MFIVCQKVSDHGIVVLEFDSGLNFPVTEHLSRIVYTHALQGETRVYFNILNSSPWLLTMLFFLCILLFSVFSAMSGSRLFSRQLYRLHCCPWTRRTSPTVWTQRNFTGLCRTKGSQDLSYQESSNVLCSYMFRIFFSQPSVLKVLLTAELPAFRHTDNVDEALQLLTQLSYYDQQYWQPITYKKKNPVPPTLSQPADQWLAAWNYCTYLRPLRKQDTDTNVTINLV